METCNSWECINSFASWLSAIGTILISGMALWLSIRDRFIRMSNNFSLGKLENNNGLKVKGYILEFTNIGIRPVMVTNYKWYIPLSNKKQKYAFTDCYLNSTLTQYFSKLPIELTDGQSGRIFMDENFFIKRESLQSFLYPKSKVKAFIRIHFFKIFICTSINNISVQISRDLRKHLWHEYLENQNNKIPNS